MHFTLYRDYILDGFKSSKGIFVDEIEKNKLHQELINKFQKFRLSLVYNLDLPYDILNMIEVYLN